MMTSMFQIKINREKCNGCGLCAKIHPENWRIMDKKAHAVKLKVRNMGLNKKAMDSCPKKAILITQI
ncbi:MAG: ferredoxin [Candidatus Nanoarchaeia archaeon]|nr:ferredoxin [Candidatus Nanoarchaeia archaeon]MDD5054431.1 ferredoxin [Candidatus Nanoarchaeia archaeon]MDD5499544.1 ferredoxin [Candidatus Nanoarchaeia archaeon]